MSGSHKGSVLGGALLIGGSCIGAGMLGLPVVCGLAGFYPSVLMMVLACAFMTATGLLLVEATSWFGRPVNLLTLVEYSLGPIGKVLCWVSYLFLFYAILVAYIALSGKHVHATLGVDASLGSLFFVLFFGSIIYAGTRPVDLINRFLMFVKIGTFLLLVGLTSKYVDVEFFDYTEAQYAFLSLPILVISFGFQNMIPSLYIYLNGEVDKVKKSVLFGSLLVFFVYLVWALIAMGTVPATGPNGFTAAYFNGRDASELMQFYIPKVGISVVAATMAFFAILTSFLAQSLSVVHFLGDGLKIKRTRFENPWLVTLTLAPPLLCSILYPNIFFKALGFAGGVCTVILFGFLPVIMVWKGRYTNNEKGKEILFGGKPLLSFIFLFALCILVYQVSNMLGIELVPSPTRF